MRNLSSVHWHLWPLSLFSLSVQTLPGFHQPQCPVRVPHLLWHGGIPAGVTRARTCLAQRSAARLVAGCCRRTWSDDASEGRRRASIRPRPPPAAAQRTSRSCWTPLAPKELHAPTTNSAQAHQSAGHRTLIRALLTACKAFTTGCRTARSWRLHDCSTTRHGAGCWTLFFRHTPSSPCAHGVGVRLSRHTSTPTTLHAWCW